MFNLISIKNHVSITLFRAQLCTLAIAVSFNSIWRVPMDSFRYGGLQFLVVQSVAMIVIALPVTLLQLATGQLSQQDVVGMWRAVPFFKGVGYLRLLITFVGSIHTLIYVALTASYFLFTLSNPVPLLECIELETTNVEGDENEDNLCANYTIATSLPLFELPEYYIAVGLMVAALWILFPFALYNPLKCMKRIFYVLGPSVLILLVIVTVAMGHKEGLTSMHNATCWRNFVEPKIWHDALTQALWSSQVAGGYLVSTGGTVYSNIDVHWTALILIGTNIVTSWLGTLFWFTIIDPVFKDNLEISLLVQAHHSARNRELPMEWPMVLFVTIFISGIISMRILCYTKYALWIAVTTLISVMNTFFITFDRILRHEMQEKSDIILLYPIYDRCNRIGGRRWRLISIASSFVGIVLTLGVLLLSIPALHILDKIVAPFIISFSTILEITAFVFIYGWKSVVEDIEFLCGGKMRKFWVLGWCATPGVLIPLMVWWMVKIIIEDSTSWESIALITSAVFAIIIFFLFGLLTVMRQEQYDCFSKFLASFKPSRHWGPRDPITHYYWLTKREEDRGTTVRSRYHKRYLNQLHERSASVIPTDSDYDFQGNPIYKMDEKQQRANSDDLVYTIYRRQYTKDQKDEVFDGQKQRSRSLDLDAPAKLSESDFKCMRDSTLGTRKLKIVQIEAVVPINEKAFL